MRRAFSSVCFFAVASIPVRMAGNSAIIRSKSSFPISTSSTWSSAVHVAVRTPAPSSPISPK